MTSNLTRNGDFAQNHQISSQTDPMTIGTHITMQYDHMELVSSHLPHNLITVYVVYTKHALRFFKKPPPSYRTAHHCVMTDPWLPHINTNMEGFHTSNVTLAHLTFSVQSDKAMK